MMAMPHFRAPSAAAPPFSPTDLGTDLRLWIRKGGTRYQDSARTTLVTASAQPVGSWTDASSSAQHPSTSGSGRPLEVAARDGANFDGADDALTTPALGAFGGDFFVGLVLTPDTLSAGYVRFLERVSGGGGVYLGTAGSGNEIIGYVNSTASSSTALSAGAKHYVALERTGTTARIYVDSATAAQTWTVSSAAIPDAATIIGGPDGGGPYYDGVIHEVVIARNTTAPQVASLLAYLATV